MSVGKSPSRPPAYLSSDLGEMTRVQEVISSSTSSTTLHHPIDIQDFTAHLNPEDYKTLEKVLGSEQAREILENLALSPHNNEHQPTGNAHPFLLDHTYSMGADEECPGKRVIQLNFDEDGSGRPPPTLVLAVSDIKIRRSLRQQDRSEREEARRILAENMAMLQKEKASMTLSLSSPIQESSLRVGVELIPKEASGIEKDECAVEDSELMRRRAAEAETAVVNMEVDNSGGGVKMEVDNNTPNLNGDEKKETKREVEEKDKEDEELDEDDPNKLWCTCRQPHNKRFMICCDGCGEWFHGKCVGVTRAQGKEFEDSNIQWHCSACRKAIKAAAAQLKKSTATAPSPFKLKSKESSGPKTPILISHTHPKQHKSQRAKGTEKMKKKGDDGGMDGMKKKKKKVVVDGDEKKTLPIPSVKTNKCISCTKTAKEDSVYCSTECVIQHSKRLAIKRELKAFRPNALSSPANPLSSGGRVKPKGGEKGMIKKKRGESVGGKEGGGGDFLSFHLISTRPSEEKMKERRGSEGSGGLLKRSESSTGVEGKGQGERKRSLGDTSSSTASKRPRLSSPPPTTTNSKTLTKKLPPPGEKERRKSGLVESRIRSPSGAYPGGLEGRRDSGGEEMLLRENSKKAIRDVLKNREGGVRKVTADEVAEGIEKELLALFGSWTHVKCKNKYRSILFNLKDPKNGMYEELLEGRLLAKELVRMEPYQMASAELTEWRTRESQKELDAIKRSELEKLVEAEKERMREGRPDFGKPTSSSSESRLTLVEEEEPHNLPQPLVIHSIPLPPQSLEARKITMESLLPANNNKQAMTEGKRKDNPSLKDKKKKERGGGGGGDGRRKKMVVEEKKGEEPSSTVNTAELDLSEEIHGMRVKDVADPLSPAVLSTRLVMPELGHLNASLYNVSHRSVKGVVFPETPVPIVGRITPDIVWDYMDKMKKNKELIVFRLIPQTPADIQAYMLFFSYLSTRNRFGVLGGLCPPLKDVYLIPLDKTGDIHPTLLPFRGPGLPADRGICLLAVVTRHIIKGKTPLKREGGRGKASLSPSTPTCANDDTPYTPWEEDTEEDGRIPPQIVGKTEAEWMLEQLTAKIEKEKADIASISSSLSSSLIPGLDGQFTVPPPSPPISTPILGSKDVDERLSFL